jgi:hypothetical protein
MSRALAWLVLVTGLLAAVLLLAEGLDLLGTPSPAPRLDMVPRFFWPK